MGNDVHQERAYRPTRIPATPRIRHTRFRWTRERPAPRTRDRLRELALRHWARGHQLQMDDDFEGALNAYRRSLRIHPTAEARTFIGWVHAIHDDYDNAIRECELAIGIDPTFGNPYNDIGSYLIELDRHDEAIPWLEKAIQSERYDARHYAYMNLGRVYARQFEWIKAKEAFRMALLLCPTYTIAEFALRRMMSRFN